MAMSSTIAHDMFQRFVKDPLMTTRSSRSPRTTTRSPVQLAALVVGAVFLLVGILGFIPGITTHYDTLTFAGHHSQTELLGIFHVSILHNLVHVAFGVAGLALARAAATAKMFLIVGGVIYLALWLYGLVIDKNSDANFVPLNTADDWLHFVLGVAMVALGVLLGRNLHTSRT
jgi:preprotein translocase subunit Sss1